MSNVLKPAGAGMVYSTPMRVDGEQRISWVSAARAVLLPLVAGAAILLAAACSAEERPNTAAPPPPGALTEDQFKALLALDDVAQVLTFPMELTTEFRNVKQIAEEEDPEQVVNVDTAYALAFTPKERFVGVAFAAIDFNSADSALAHFEQVGRGPGGSQMPATDSLIGDASASLLVGERGIGGIVIFVKGDRFISMHTAVPEDLEPPVTLEGLEQLAATVEGRLGRGPEDAADAES